MKLTKGWLLQKTWNVLNTVLWEWHRVIFTLRVQDGVSVMQPFLQEHYLCPPDEEPSLFRHVRMRTNKRTISLSSSSLCWGRVWIWTRWVVSPCRPAGMTQLNSHFRWGNVMAPIFSLGPSVPTGPFPESSWTGSVNGRKAPHSLGTLNM